MDKIPKFPPGYLKGQSVKATRESLVNQSKGKPEPKPCKWIRVKVKK